MAQIYAKYKFRIAGLGDNRRYLHDNTGLIDKLYEDQKISINDIAVRHPNGNTSLINHENNLLRMVWRIILYIITNGLMPLK